GVAVSWPLDLKEAQCVADRLTVFFVYIRGVLHDAWCRGQPDLYCVEMVERAAPLAVDAAMTFVDDDQVEVASRIVGIFVDQGLQCDDRDPLLVLEAAPDARYAIARQIRQALGKGVLGLDTELIAVDHEQSPRNPIRLKQAL